MAPGPAPAIKANFPIATTIAACIGVTWYISVEIIIRLFITFKRRRSLYFWSCCLSSWGILLNSLAGGIFRNFGVITNRWGSSLLIYISWAMMLLGQSLVLYSRLHLVMNNQRHLRWVLGTIVFTGLGVIFPTVVVGMFRAVRHDKPSFVMDKYQVTVVFVQEIILSALYVYQTKKHLKASTALTSSDKTARLVMRHLFLVNILMIFLDIIILVMSYITVVFYVQASLKPVVYAVKLRIEFAILNKLVKAVNRQHRLSTATTHTQNTSLSGTPWSHTSWQPQLPGIARIESFSCRGCGVEISSPIIKGGLHSMDLGFQTSVLDTKDLDADRILQTTEISVTPSEKEMHESITASNMV
ncbi:hypothetical protein BDV96DRAFT_578625 [Lophiotrema nucula]|uniref:DUF7703 domain-containing protein n=1 Tax=Lophiotrema nucula TaxID=690887 RepID=A0A6A5Z2H9_9PLEO|nr:hypothetical protein BDV96DRAFT_578625 [Lophiotrema nucula]